ncbi:ABC transporter [Annulohypoxylon maeteangense]|uniref:ABC transporter n=1 Tax=Annulohypoxylon maeteangense TaxID=1927788 RepID=UPI002008D40D|nr:ABC transporter [Annulohypoxylon maeteangense]KAI0881278.1 ABC transporter [Annulohypoxylon maeteangense]
MNCTAQEDALFGPAVGIACRGGFDFTLLFEQSILTIPLSGICSLALLARLGYLSKREPVASGGIIRLIKLVVAAIFLGIQAYLVALWDSDDDLKTGVSIAASSINLVVAFLVLVLLWLEDSRSVRPSSVLSAYLFFSALLDLPQVRTLWLKGSNTTLASLFSAGLTAKVVLLFLEAQNKRNRLKWTLQDLPPESTSGIINRSFLWWVNSIFRSGFSAVLAVEDLYDIDEPLTSKILFDAISASWASRKIPERRLEYPLAVIRAFWVPLLLTAIPRLFLIGFTFSQPFLISRTLELLSGPDSEASRQQGYGLIGAAALVYLGLAFLTLHYNHNLNRFVTMFRGATDALIYERVLHVQSRTYDETAAVTLMSTDVDRVVFSLESLNEVWARVIEVAVGITLLALQLGWVCIVPIIVVVVSSFGAKQISKNIGGRQKVWVDAVQKRISVTTSVLSEIKAIKMMGLSDVLTKKLQEHRVDETHRMAGFRWSIVYQNVVQNFPDAIAPALTFAVYTGQAIAQGSDSIGTTKAFTSLAIITLLTGPVSKLLSAIPNTSASLGCYDRIQKFLVAPPRKDYRLIYGSKDDQSMQSDQLPSFSDDADSSTVNTIDEEIALRVDNISLRPTPDSDVILEKVSFGIKKGSFTMILGPVGVGKSTLLASLLGEVPPEHGSITISTSRVAFCSQTPWLPNFTIRDVVSMPSENVPFDDAWYQTVLHACALEEDLKLLPAGDQTKIGSSGTILSGGQKARVALARAIYSRCRILILDGVASALDAKTKLDIGQRLLSKDGLLRELGATVLLAGSTEYLNYVDQVLILGQRGLRFEGTCDRALAEGLIESGQGQKQESQGERESETESDIEEKAEEVSKVDELNDLKRATGDLTIYRYYFATIGKWKLFAFVFFVILNVFCSAFSQIWLKWWSDAGGGQLGLYISVYLVLAILSSIGNGGYVWAILILISPSTARKLHYTLLKTVMRAPQSFFSSTDSGTILNRFSQDMTLIESQLAIGMLITVSNFFSVLASVALVATGSSYMGATIPLLIIAIGVIQHFYLRTSRQLRLLDLEAKSPLYSNFLETLTGLETIRAFGWEKTQQKANNRLLDLSQRPYYLLYCIQQWLTLVLDLIVAAEAVLVVGLALGLRSSTSPGLLGVSMNNVLSFNSHLASLVTGWTQLETSLGSIARVRDFEMQISPEGKEGEDQVPPSNWPEKGAIHFTNVTASHNSTSTALRDVSLSIKPGQKISICGRTGSGKSSLVGTLLRLLEIDSGTIQIDGLDVSTIPRETIRARLVTIPQDPLILVDTVRFNIDPRSAHADSDIINALERVGLWSLLQARGGLDAEITGSSLSRGQQQLFALARALLREGKVLLLDEPTSHVDPETDATIQKILRDEFADCTVLMVSHRLDGVMEMDAVVVMDEGKVVEMGNPVELAKTDGRFAALVAANDFGGR